MKYITAFIFALACIAHACINYTQHNPIMSMLAFAPFAVGPLAVCVYLAFKLKTRQSQRIIFGTSLMYGTWLLVSYIVLYDTTAGGVRSLGQSLASSGQIAFATGMIALPIMAPLWLLAYRLDLLTHPNDAPGRATGSRRRIFFGSEPADQITLAVLVGTTIELGGYYLVHGKGFDMGFTMFFVVPWVAGFAMACIVSRRGFLAGTVVAVLLSSAGGMLAFRWEGLVCLVLAMPVLLPSMLLGAGIGHGIRHLTKNVPNKNKITVVLLLMSPLFIGAVNQFEKPYRSVEQLETITTEILLPTSPEQSWALLTDMQPLDGPKPLLMQLGLPIPTSCKLDYPGVGSDRTCYFEQGAIFQRITAWEPAAHMSIDITRTTLPSRHWLSYHTASYDLVPVENGTKIIRHTTIGSRLYPRWYWAPLERLGVETEHDYVLANLKAWAIVASEKK